MLGVVVALETERRWIPRQAAALVERTGIGAARAEAGALRLLEHGATALVSWGTAGGLDPSLATGAVVVPAAVIAVDGDELQAHGPWRERLIGSVSAAVPVSPGPLVEARTMVESRQQKRELYRATGAAAVDMESGAVARVAARRRVPWIAVRVILDHADETVPGVTTELTTPTGELDPGALRRVVVNPVQWPALLRLARAHRAARRSLRLVWRTSAPELAS